MQTHSPSPLPKVVWIKLLAGLIVVALAVAGYFAFFSQHKAPDVTFVDLQGNKLSTQELRGKVVMVNFWATSCTTCVKEMPQMVETYKKYQGRGLEFVAVAMSYDPPNYVVNFVQTRQLPFKVALDVEGKLAKSFGDVQLTPTTFVIDKDGHIVKRYLGEPDWKGLHALLEQSLT
ncbi:TlpA disulfide reductase family protein [Janthinobacterium sp. 17J80-10]|uniref:TlpA disulfide reductase family protein n=1 Tax=Janthinobacterium sp. 17J80-10 TaxID=2497863 RepID=UPI001005891A|nr:TlpA disulfide reductase family protein [Janthinobacterium sp. 17J80-10]QAU33207.1 TlpA family protein disulfide reductase [Janthinobacterium sp. 17J80-10]